jgi:hypothetical protein
MTTKIDRKIVACPECGSANWTATISGIQVWTIDTEEGLGLFFCAKPDDPPTLYGAVCEECSHEADAETLARLTAVICDPDWSWEQ